jgi:hypothetical protein
VVDPKRRKITILASVLALGVTGLTAANAAAASQSSTTASFQATGLTPLAPPVEVAKSRTGKLAKSDPALLARTDTAQVSVMVKYDYDPVASYEGDIAGLEATSPSITGKSLKKNTKAVQAYRKHIDTEQADITANLKARVPSAKPIGSYQTAYGGVAVRIPANQAKELLKVPGVVAVQSDKLEQPQTDATPDFIGATQVWPGLGGSLKAGEGVILGVLDTGIWPEHPSFKDNGLKAPPGGPFACDFGDGTDPALGAAFQCNNKLIGAYAFTDTYMAVTGAGADEYCNATTKKCSARDSDGHGTHTSSTAAGTHVDTAPLLGVDRGPISGIAPGAHVIMYRVCLSAGCYNSDSVAAVEQAIIDGVNVINFSISGGNNAYSDPVELAFLDAFAAGISVNASAGNSGPGAATANHAGPWVTTVGASTSNRFFESTMTLKADNGDTYSKIGSTVTQGVGATPIVLAQNVPGYTGTELCLTPFPSGSLTGKVVACKRGSNARVEKGYNALQGGAAGMVLYNPTASDTETDNHWLPAIHLEGPNDEMLTFLGSHTGVTATWGPGQRTTVRGDIMAGFSSRGPLGDFLKPDVTAPGVQILAGNTPTPDAITNGPPGQYFQAIAGTSMSSPHSAGVSALVKAAHPDWSPAQIKSALMTSSVQNVLKEDGKTPADAWDRGAGSIRANTAVNPTVTFDVSAANYAASAADPLHRIDLNLPSINANPMPGAVTTTRTVKNVTDKTQTFKVITSTDKGASITVSPSSFAVLPGKTQKLTITISATTAADGWHFGQITLDAGKKANSAVLPVTFNKTQGGVALEHSCTPDTVTRGQQANCAITATNNLPVEASVNLQVTVPNNLKLTSPFAKKNTVAWSGTLSPSLAPAIDSIPKVTDSPGEGYSYPLSLFGIRPVDGMGDETFVNYDVSDFKYGSETYNRIGVSSNGYVVIGGMDANDQDYEPQTFPNPDRPNNVLAPFWTDLSFAPATGGGALRVGSLTDGVDSWIVIDFAGVKPWSSNPSTAPTNSFQVWIQVGNTEGIWYDYGSMGGSPHATTMGAENRDGSSGVNGDVSAATKGTSWQVLTSPPQAGGSVTIPYGVSSDVKGTYTLLGQMTSPLINGTTTRNVMLTVK